jgi:hypothetical protein
LEIATPNATPTVRTRRDAMLSNNAFQKICRACFKTIAPLNPFSYDYERVEKNILFLMLSRPFFMKKAPKIKNRGNFS